MGYLTYTFLEWPRGTESQSLTTSSGTVLSYPLYDAHGNAIGQLRRDPGNFGGFLVGDQRHYDPWGQVLTSGAGARPVQGFCASLGHRRDDKTGLVYMRARYYDPQAGRFVSQDPAMQGANWFAYCGNDSVNFVDETGCSLRSVLCGTLTAASIVALLAGLALSTVPGAEAASTLCLAVATFAATVAFCFTGMGMGATVGLVDTIVGGVIGLIDVIATIAEGAQWGMRNGLTAVATAAGVGYCITILALCISAMMEPFEGGFNDEWN